MIVENFTPRRDVQFQPRLRGSEEDQSRHRLLFHLRLRRQRGPYRDRPAYDQIMQGVSGLMSITGDLGGDPQKVGIAVSDIGAGMWAAFAIMAALFHRNSPNGKGAGQYIDLSMLDAQVAWMTYQAGYYFATGEAPQRLGAAHPTLVPYQGFKGKRRQILQRRGRLRAPLGSVLPGHRTAPTSTMTPITPPTAIGLTTAPNWSRLLEEHFQGTRDADDWVADLQAVSVPAGPINDLKDVFN